MTAPVITAAADEPLVQAICTMREHRVSSVVVVKDRVPVGIVTERDVLEVAASGQLDELRVSDVMTAPPETIDESLEVAAALGVMRERGFRHMPVVHHDELVGRRRGHSTRCAPPCPWLPPSEVLRCQAGSPRSKWRMTSSG